jgi:hypothetical protein
MSVDVAFGDPIIGEPETVATDDVLAFAGITPLATTGPLDATQGPYLGNISVKWICAGSSEKRSSGDWLSTFGLADHSSFLSGCDVAACTDLQAR